MTGSRSTEGSGFTFAVEPLPVPDDPDGIAEEITAALDARPPQMSGDLVVIQSQVKAALARVRACGEARIREVALTADHEPEEPFHDVPAPVGQQQSRAIAREVLRRATDRFERGLL